MPEALRRPRAWLLLAVLLWTGYALGVETVATVSRQTRPVRNIRQPSRWLPGTRHVLLLEKFLADVDARVPARQKRIAFSAPGPPLSDGLYQYLWASYLLPERDLVPPGADLSGLNVRYLAAFRSRVDDPRYKVVARFDDGILYRIRP
jgi:hypothetical protein